MFPVWLCHYAVEAREDAEFAAWIDAIYARYTREQLNHFEHNVQVCVCLRECVCVCILYVCARVCVCESPGVAAVACACMCVCLRRYVFSSEYLLVWMSM